MFLESRKELLERILAGDIPDHLIKEGQWAIDKKIASLKAYIARHEPVIKYHVCFHNFDESELGMYDFEHLHDAQEEAYELQREGFITTIVPAS